MDNVADLLPRGTDAEHLSYPQRIVALEAAMATVANVALGCERLDGTRSGGLREQIRDLQRTVWVGGGMTIFLSIVQTFGFAEAIKRAIIFTLGGH